MTTEADRASCPNMIGVTVNSDSLFFNTYLNSLAIASHAADADETETSFSAVKKLLERSFLLEKLTLTKTRIQKRSKNAATGLGS